MVNITLLVGPPGSGKSTKANELVKTSLSAKVSRDDIRHSLKQVWYTTQDLEDTVSAIQDATVKALIKKGVDIVIDNTHCRIAHIKEFILKYGKETNIALYFVGSELSLADLLKRNETRDKAVPEEVIRNMYAGYLHVRKNAEELRTLILATSQEPEHLYFINQDPKLPKAIIVDIDGTIAHMEGKRGPYEWHKVGVDTPDHNVLNVVRSLSKDYKIFFVSGRDESCRAQTTEWLEKWYLYKDSPGREWELYMRPAKNYEKDSIIKNRIFKEKFVGKYYVEMLFDDRQQVVDQYRSMGLKVAQVAEGNF